MTLGEKLKKLRKTKDLRLHELADIFTKEFNSGTTKSIISLWENDKSIPSRPSIEMYSTYFDISMDYLLGTEDKKETEIDVALILNEKQLETLETFIQSTNLLFFNGKITDTEEKINTLRKPLTKAFIEILKTRGEIKF